jgi:TonB-linked SusC/RagA family outer membrane protein
LDEVVVVGYGTQKKGNLTAAISTIKAEDIQTTTATSIAHKLQGKMPGLNIRQNTGEPGVYDNSINIRGFGTPLYVIDGIQRPASVFQRINGADIENISVLKDAAAAVYGINAANGVVIVTTKHGGKGKTDFKFSSTVGFSTPTDVPRMCNAYEYLTLRNEANINIGLEPFITKEELEKWKIGGPGYESTDWYGATFNDYSMRQEYNLSAEGGTEKVSYYFNVGGAFDNGMMKTNDLFYQRLSFRSNISAQLTDRIKAVVNIAAVNDKRESPTFGIIETWGGVIKALPTKKVYANDNPLYLHRVQDGQGMNPVALISSDLTGYNRSNNNDYITSLELSYEAPFIKGLELKGVAAYEKTYNMGKSVFKDFALYDYNVETDTYQATKFYYPAYINNSYSNVYYTTVQVQANYKTVYKDDHNISATLVYEVRDAAERHAYLLKYFDFYTNDQIDQAGDTNAQSSGNEWHTRNLSYIGRANYDYKGRYLIEFAGRYDGSYRYHPDRRWGFFPLVSAGWRISDEKFMKALSPVLSNLKLRTSYGKIGEDVGNAFQYVPGFTTGGGWWEFSEGKTTLGLSTPAIVNEKLTWMSSTLTDIGIDLSFFKNKLELAFDWYQKDRSGLLAYRNVSLPNTYGGAFPQENLNRDRVRGFDFSFDYKDRIGDLNYRVSGNFNYARSKAVYIEQGSYANSWDIYRSNQTGRYQGIVWNYNVVGQYRSEEEIVAGAVQNGVLGNRYVFPGDFIYEDVNGDNIIDENDVRPHFYDATPKMNYGLTLGASWKGFGLSALFQGAALFSIRLTNVYTTMFWGEANLPAYFLDRWHQEDPYDPDSPWIAGKWPAMRADQAGLLYIDSDVWRKDCSYIRLKNIELGYTFPQHYSKKFGLDNLRLFVDVNNIYTWADSFIKPFDPEKVAGTYDAGWAYPIMRTFNIGLDINF